MKNCSGINCPMQYGVVDAATCSAVECCPNATPPLTNYDRIRAMDIDHLIEWYCRGRPCGTCPYNGVECSIRDWLKQEAGE